MDLFSYIGDQIRLLRKARGLSQEELGREMGVPTNTISRWETTTYKPGIGDLERLARFFGVSILKFFPGQEAKDERLVALLRAAKDLGQEDLEELQRYAEFRRARQFYKATPRRRKQQS